MGVGRGEGPRGFGNGSDRVGGVRFRTGRSLGRIGYPRGIRFGFGRRSASLRFDPVCRIVGGKRLSDRLRSRLAGRAGCFETREPRSRPRWRSRARRGFGPVEGTGRGEGGAPDAARVARFLCWESRAGRVVSRSITPRVLVACYRVVVRIARARSMGTSGGRGDRVGDWRSVVVGRHLGFAGVTWGCRAARRGCRGRGR